MIGSRWWWWGAVAVLPACTMPPETACDEANRFFQECGVTVPLFDVDECTAAPEAVATCLMEVAHGCNDLTTWFERLGDCATGFGIELGPLNPDLE